MDAGAVAELREGLWGWRARHPDWHPADAFGALVTSYAVDAGGEPWYHRG